MTAARSFACGLTISINHTDFGGVAPVNKTVSYGTVTGIPGEPAKCWITRNLGADHQATAVNDATEPSAGWYWQFNRKQGYKHDGTTRTPTTWIPSIIENSNWLQANDPCRIELGVTWRIPTYTEFFNVDNTGGWTTWSDPWNSGLKMHGAGFLDSGTGALLDRGSVGHYWISVQSDYVNAANLTITSSDCVMGIWYWKQYGHSVRCIREY
jgi:hypothetical protein